MNMNYRQMLIKRKWTLLSWFFIRVSFAVFLLSCSDETETDSTGGDQEVLFEDDIDLENEARFESEEEAKEAEASEEPLGRYFHFAALADTHIIDDYYTGPEGNELDTQTIFETKDNLKTVRTYLNAFRPKLDLCVIAGDFIHDYPSGDWDFYIDNETRVDIAKTLIDGFEMPVHVSLGNHDYSLSEASREFTHRLFKEKLGIDPYYVVEHRGYKFYMLNNFLGDTWDKESDRYQGSLGSFGREQLEWLDEELTDKKPSILVFHHPIVSLLEEEYPDLDMYKLLQKHKETIKLVIMGHTHRWLDLKDQFGPWALVIGSTRYDTDAYALFRVDTETDHIEFLNKECYQTYMLESAPYDPFEQACLPEE